MDTEPEDVGAITSPPLAIPETDYQLVTTVKYPLGIVRATADVHKKFDFA